MSFEPLKLKKELLYFIRNSDVISIATRGVTTTTETATLSSADEYIVSQSNIKNFREVKVDTNTLTYGKDFTVNLNYDNNADGQTDSALISFTSSQTGELSITYDYGTEKIYPDFPRDDLSISSYPRIAVDMMDSPIEAFGIGGTKTISEINFTLVVYDEDLGKVDEMIDSIKDKIENNMKEFYYTPFIRPQMIGPAIVAENRKSEIVHRNIDLKAQFNVN